MISNMTNNDNYLVLQDALLSLGITAPATIKTFHVLVCHWANNDNLYNEFMSVLAKDAGVSVISVKRAIKQLASEGLILKYHPKKRLDFDKRSRDGGILVENFPLQIRPSLKLYDTTLFYIKHSSPFVKCPAPSVSVRVRPAPNTKSESI